MGEIHVQRKELNSFGFEAERDNTVFANLLIFLWSKNPILI